MRKLIAAVGASIVPFVLIVWLCGYYASNAPIANAASSPITRTIFTAHAKRPTASQNQPRYEITSKVIANASGPIFNHARTWSRNNFPKFSPLRGYQSVDLRDENRRGQIVGSLRYLGSGAWMVIKDHGFLWQKGKMHDLGALPKYQISHAVAINNRGEIAGDSAVGSFPTDSNSPSHAVCWIHENIYDLGEGWATALNDHGDIVGDSGKGPADYSQAPHALLWRRGYRYDLNNLIPAKSGWLLEEARAINNKGQIVGNGTLNGQPHAFLLTPR